VTGMQEGELGHAEQSQPSFL